MDINSYTYKKKKFIILIFVFFFMYCSEYFINVYLNLIFRVDFKFSMTALGVLSSLGPILAFLAQPFWGLATDRAKTKNKVLLFLFLAVSFSYLGFLIIYKIPSKTIAFILCCAITCIVYFFFQPISSLLNAIALEFVSSTKWDFSILRSTGSFGYSFTALVMSIVTAFVAINLKSTIFLYFSLVIITFLIALFLPKIKGHQFSKEKNKIEKKASFFSIFKIPALKAMLIFTVLASIANGLTNTFFSIYFVEEIGATQSQLNLFPFLSAFFEIPAMIITGKLINKYSFRAFITVSTVVTIFKYLSFAFVTNPIIILFIGPIQGFGGAIRTYCDITYINENSPLELKASSQAALGLINISFSRLSSVIGGVMADLISMQFVYIFSAVFLIIVLTISFKFLPHKKASV